MCLPHLYLRFISSIFIGSFFWDFQKLISGMKFSWNVDCFRLLFPSPFVAFLKQCTYLPVKNNWTPYVTKIIRFLFHTLSFYTRNRPKTHFIRGFALGKSFPNRKNTLHMNRRSLVTKIFMNIQLLGKRWWKR